MAHHTKDKGDLGVAKAHADLVDQGFMVLWPTTEHAPFDLVAYRDEVFLRVQVKYRSQKNGVIKVMFQSTWADRHGTHKRPVDKSSFDVVCIYCPDTGQCYYTWPNDHPGAICLRLTPTKNNQSFGVTMAVNCRLLDPSASQPNGSFT